MLILAIIILLIAVAVLIYVSFKKDCSNSNEGFAGERRETSPILLRPAPVVWRRVIDAKNSGKSSDNYLVPSNYDLIALEDWNRIGYLQNENMLKLELYINQNISSQYLALNEDVNFAQVISFGFVIQDGQTIEIKEITPDPFTAYLDNVRSLRASCSSDQDCINGVCRNGHCQRA